MSDVLDGTAQPAPCEMPHCHLSGVTAVLSRRCGPTGTAAGLRGEEWVLRFPPRWRGRMDPLTGWWGGGDPLESLTLRFSTRRAAEDYARREGIRLEVSGPPPTGDACERLAVPVAAAVTWADPSLPWIWDGRAALPASPAEDEADIVDVDLALLDPAAVFADPMQVATHPRLAREQKLEILARWEWDARLIEAAQAEGMPDGGEPSRLEEVLAARRALETGVPTQPSLQLVKGGLHAAPARRPDTGPGLAA
jgi:hypothetical protein